MTGIRHSRLSQHLSQRFCHIHDFIQEWLASDKEGILTMNSGTEGPKKATNKEGAGLGNWGQECHVATARGISTKWGVEPLGQEIAGRGVQS